MVEKKQEGVKEKTVDKEKIEAETSKVSKQKNPWIASTVILVIVAVVASFFALKGGGITGNVISEKDASDKLISYLNTKAGGGVAFSSSEDLGTLYGITVSYKGDEIPLFITKDGKYFIQGAIPLTEQVTQPTQEQEQPPQNIQKSDKPKVELFVMTHCPYGTQAEKGLIPALETLKDKIDGKIRFVHYFMHGDKEEQETYKQLCIREEQSDKYLTYLKCFLEAEDSENCTTKAKINKAKLNSCMASKAKEYYAADSKLSQDYGVQGSPTLVVNGQQVSSGRDSASYLSTICSAFNKAPEECSTQLSSQSPSPGFGYSASGEGGTEAQCG